MSTPPDPRPPRRRPFGVSPALALDLVTSYGVNFARAGSMLAIVALLGHRTSTGYLAAFLFLRSTLGLINNLFAGAQPAALAAMRPARVAVPTAAPDSIDGPSTTTLAYESAAVDAGVPAARAAAPPTLGWDALFLASVAPAFFAYLAVTLCLPLLLASAAPMLPASRAHAIVAFALAFAVGSLARVASDPAGGVLQSRGLLWLDNLLVATAEGVWVWLAFAGARNAWGVTFVGVGDAFEASGVGLFVARWAIAGALLIDVRRFSPRFRVGGFRVDVAWRFLTVSGLLAFASLGDFLYAPANHLIISRMLDPILIADYGPALQVDAVLILLVSGLAGVMLPRVVALHERGDLAGIRRAYLAATACGTLLLVGGAGVTLAFAGPVLRAWLGEVPPGTPAILPWVLAHCVLGGCGGIGRAVLLGIGRFKVWTIASLAGGATNASLALLMVSLGFGLRGVVIATIVTVTLRNAVWMPWYILRALRASPPHIGSRSAVSS